MVLYYVYYRGVRQRKISSRKIVSWHTTEASANRERKRILNSAEHFWFEDDTPSTREKIFKNRSPSEFDYIGLLGTGALEVNKEGLVDILNRSNSIISTHPLWKPDRPTIEDYVGGKRKLYRKIGESLVF